MDAFVTKLGPSGALAYSTYLGGSVTGFLDGDDIGEGIAVDASGNAHVTGRTISNNFPTLNAIRPARSGGYDAFVTKLTAAGSGLLYSTYLGGGIDDFGESIAVDNGGNAVVTGSTLSPTFPTANAIQPTNAGSFDGFVTKINPPGSAFVYSTYLGGTSYDEVSTSPSTDPATPTSRAVPTRRTSPGSMLSTPHAAGTLTPLSPS